MKALNVWLCRVINHISSFKWLTLQQKTAEIYVHSYGLQFLKITVALYLSDTCSYAYTEGVYRLCVASQKFSSLYNL